MAYVITEPDAFGTAAAALATAGSAVAARNSAAAAVITAVIPAAADEVSALTAQRFGIHGERYQQVSAQALAIHQDFMAALLASGRSYAAAEAANAMAAH
ncbi:PE family protein [Mycobacterium persicum]|uniref:PE family protein n=1 Tax=Mycobacterium persicum TaxID=1487726 RepID=A0A1X0L5L4_9MYCO|nr:PE family protein [Mycobacterium persicum]KZS82714.1 PE family protein [Mycobacterium persicum]ORB47063.1 PE family protein [Mycobacterium persicum]ORB88799.1 PE family protein [Mycobacterium persicum]ORB94173.1 PE family protein [Mycobacterium persicum]ORC00857.1 PE family protein [Mycobacterium persicum]